MKALSIKEPWASMIKNGEKTIEIRTWKTSYRGKLLLCASKVPTSDISGMAFAEVDLSDIRLMREEDAQFSRTRRNYESFYRIIFWK